MLLFTICAAVLCWCNYTSALSENPEPDALAVGDAACESLSKGGVRCVSKTQFVMGYQDTKTDQPLSCFEGTVCANTAEICSASLDPMCTNEIPGAKGVCNVCPSGAAGYNPICVSNTEFAFCVNGKVLATLKYKCTAPTPYCKAAFDSAGKLIGICTADSTKTDCSAISATAATGRSLLKGKVNAESKNDRPNDKKAEEPPAQKQYPEFVCAEEGYFADTSDKSCQSYITCKKESSGSFSKTKLKCSTANTVFNASTKRCVSAESYTCSV